MHALTFPELPLSIPVPFLSVPERSATPRRTASYSLRQSREEPGECLRQTGLPMVWVGQTGIRAILLSHDGQHGARGLLQGSHDAEDWFYPRSLQPP